MIDKLKKNISLHSSFLLKINSITDKIIAAAKDSESEETSLLCSQREEKVKVLAFFQSEIEKSLQSIPRELLDQDTVDEIKKWHQTYLEWIELISHKDQIITDILEQDKSETQKEIATLFSKKQRFSKYNTDNLKNR